MVSGSGQVIKRDDMVSGSGQIIKRDMISGSGQVIYKKVACSNIGTHTCCGRHVASEFYITSVKNK